jgi:tetratricopeptide (TPR) repeat protein
LWFVLGCFACTPIARAQLASLDAQTAEIFGTVLLEVGKHPIGDVIVSVRSVAGGPFASVLTDSSGHFQIRGLTPGNYEIVLEEPGYEPTRASLQLYGASQPLELYLRASHLSPRRRTDYAVSARELRIPDKARKAFQSGMERLAKTDTAGSRTQFARAIAAFPDYYEAYYLLGVAELRLGRDQEAADAFQKAIDLSSGRYAWAQFSLGLVLCRHRAYGEAESVIRRGLEVDSNSAIGQFFLSIVLFEQNHLEEAEQSAREALLRNPGLAVAYLTLADVHGSKHQFAMQLHDLDAYLKLVPDGPAHKRIREVREVVQGMVSKAKDRG